MHFSKLTLSAAASLLVSSCQATAPTAGWAQASAKNFIYIVPDGFGPASQAMARDFVSLLKNGENVKRPVTYQLAADQMVLGSVRTLASDNLVTDSAASATAFGCSVKTYNGAIAVDDDKQPVGSILEAAKLDGFMTGLIATSRITHATPACYAAHVVHRDSEAKIAEHEIGYGHPLGSVVDVMLGGGRCFFTPSTTAGSCRKDNIDLLKWGKDQGMNVFTDRASFDKLKGGEDVTTFPYVGLFTEGHMSYEVDRLQNVEPSLLEMTKTALTSLDKATKKSRRGYFIMIEASRIDHAGHSNDPVGHLHDVIQYNEVMDFVRSWIDAHDDTQMLSAADHECGGLTLPGYDPLVLKAANASTEALSAIFSKYTGSDAAGFLTSTIFPSYGLTNPTDAEVATLVGLRGKSDWQNQMGKMLSARGGINWSSGGHSAQDVTLYGYANERLGRVLKQNMAGNWDNAQLPLYLEQMLKLKVKMADATLKLREKGTQWVGRSIEARSGEEHHHHEHN